MDLTIHDKLFAEVLPLYTLGRPMDADHISWMYTNLCKLLPLFGVVTDIVIPLVILHDIGYSALPAQNPFELDIRRSHMEKGAMMARPLMSTAGYDRETTDKVCNMIAIHDLWALGEHEPFHKYRELGILNDLDFIWMATIDGFIAHCEILGKTPIELFAYISGNEKLVNRPFMDIGTESVYLRNMVERKQELMR